jgi:hypothetical protein
MVTTQDWRAGLAYPYCRDHTLLLKVSMTLPFINDFENQHKAYKQPVEKTTFPKRITKKYINRFAHK